MPGPGTWPHRFCASTERADARALFSFALAAALAASPSPARGSQIASGPAGGPEVVVHTGSYLFEAHREDADPVVRWEAVSGVPARTVPIYIDPDLPDAPDLITEGLITSTDWAIDAWNRVPGLPVRFVLTADPEQAAVTVTWIDHFDRRRAGVTRWKTDGEGWMRDVDVILALRHSDGTPIGPEFFRYVVLHEFGHVLGLPHSEDPADVMHPGNRNLLISLRDRRTLQELYALPPELVGRTGTGHSAARAGG